MSKTYDLICRLNEALPGYFLEKIEGYSVVGSPRSNAYAHPIQYRAISNTLPGEDDPFEGIGWTVDEALKDLLKSLLAEAK